MTDFDIDREALNEEGISKTILELPHQAINKLTTLMKFVFENLTEASWGNAARKSNLFLLSRIYNDLRSIYHLSSKGYSVQAATIACGLYEAALTVMVIGDDENKGLSWLKHKNMKTTFEPVGKIRNDAKKIMKWSKDTSVNSDLMYAHLSMAKHSNAMIISVHSIIKDLDSEPFSYGSEISKNSYRLSWYAALMSVQLGQIAIGYYYNNSNSDFDELLLSKLHKLNSELSDIIKENIEASAKKYGELKSGN